MTPWPRLSRWRSTATSLVTERSGVTAALLLVLFALNCAISVYDDTVTYDEPGHLEIGSWLLGGSVDHCRDQKMPITALNALPGAWVKALGLSLSDKNLLWISRLPTVCFAVVVGYFVFEWSRKLYGGRGGLFSLLLFVFCPTTIAHARMAANDLYCAGFSLLAVHSFLRYLDAPSRRSLLRAAALMGVAQLTKHTALLLFPVLAVTFVVRTWARWRPSPGSASWPPRRIARDGVVYVLVVWAVLNVGYGLRPHFATLAEDSAWLQANTEFVPATPRQYDSELAKIPIPLPRAYVEAILFGQYFNRTGRGHGPDYLFGELRPLGWWYYFPVAFALKTPLPTLLVLGMAIVVTVRKKRWGLGSDEGVLLLVPFVVLVFFCSACSADIGVRYLLPIMPFLYVFAGKVVAFTPSRWSTGWNTSVLVLSVWLPITSLSYFPHYISYFNEISWNRLLLYESLSDSNLQWGQDDGYLQQYIDTHPGRVTVNPESPVTGTVIVDTNRLTGVTSDLETYRWLREGHTPVSRAAYSWLVYEIPERQSP